MEQFRQSESCCCRGYSISTVVAVLVKEVLNLSQTFRVPLRTCVCVSEPLFFSLQVADMHLHSPAVFLPLVTTCSASVRNQLLFFQHNVKLKPNYVERGPF